MNKRARARCERAIAEYERMWTSEYPGAYLPLTANERAALLDEIERHGGEEFGIGEACERHEEKVRDRADAIRHCCINTSLLDGEHRFFLGNQAFDVTDLKAVFIAMSQGANGLVDVFHFMSERTLRRWHKKGKADVEDGGAYNDAKRAPYVWLFRAYEGGRAMYRKRLIRAASGDIDQVLDGKDKVRAAQTALARMDKATDPLRHAQIAKAKSEARLAQIKERIMDKAEELMDGGDFDAAVRLLTMTPSNGTGGGEQWTRMRALAAASEHNASIEHLQAEPWCGGAEHGAPTIRRGWHWNGESGKFEPSNIHEGESIADDNERMSITRTASNGGNGDASNAASAEVSDENVL